MELARARCPDAKGRLTSAAVLTGWIQWLLGEHGTNTRRSWRKLVWGFLCQAVIGVFLFGSEKDWGGRSEGSSPSVARSSRRNLVFGDPIGSDHDAAMRIGSEAPGRRAHSAQRLGGHACARVATTSDRHRRFVTRAWTNPEFGWLSFQPWWSCRSSQDNAVRRFACGHQPPKPDKQLSRQRHDQGLACARPGVGGPRAIPLRQGATLLVEQKAPG